MAKYQHASDFISGMPPYSGVIRDDGRWIANAASDEWTEFLAWAAKNEVDPYKSPADGGLAIKLQEGEVAVGAMNDSLPPPTTGSAAPAEAAKPPAEPAPPTSGGGRR